jgi:prefoldin subunit 5
VWVLLTFLIAVISEAFNEVKDELSTPEGTRRANEKKEVLVNFLKTKLSRWTPRSTLKSSSADPSQVGDQNSIGLAVMNEKDELVTLITKLMQEVQEMKSANQKLETQMSELLQRVK